MRTYDAEGDRAPAHGPARHLCADPRPGGDPGGHRLRHAPRTTCSCDLPRARRAAHARREDVGALPLLGRRRARQRLRRAARRLSDLRDDRRAASRTRRASPMRSSSRRESRAVVCALGDGATSKGDFYEGLNAAGAWQLPARLRRDQQPVGDLGAAPGANRRADARAEGDRGGHPVASRSTATISSRCATRWTSALAKARSGGGPTLIEAAHLPPLRSHDRRRRVALPQRRRAGRSVAARADRTDAHLPGRVRARGTRRARRA